MRSGESGGTRPSADSKCEKASSYATDRTACAAYFQSAWDLSHPGELYGTAPEQIATICDSLNFLMIQIR